MPKSAKIALASLLGVAAIFVLLWDFGVFEGKPKPPPNPTANFTPAQQRFMTRLLADLDYPERSAALHSVNRRLG